MASGRLGSASTLGHVIERAIRLRDNNAGPIFIAIDGPDCAGKSTFARNIASELKDMYEIILIHFDDYANSKEIREKQGEFSVLGFQYDYFDEGALLRTLSAIKDATIDFVLVEGLFLLRPSIASCFSLRIRIEVAPDTVLERAMARDVGQIGDAKWVRRHYVEQCIPAQEQYVAAFAPDASADVLLFSCPDGSIELRR